MPTSAPRGASNVSSVPANQPPRGGIPAAGTSSVKGEDHEGSRERQADRRAVAIGAGIPPLPQGSGVRFGEDQPIARQGVDDIEGDPTDDPVIAVRQIGRVRVFRIVREEYLRSPAGNPRHQIAPRRLRIFPPPSG